MGAGFENIKKPNPQDFVVTEGVSVNPHNGLNPGLAWNEGESKWGYAPKNEYEGIGNYGNDAPTYRKIDEEGYKKVQEEYEKQKAIRAKQLQQFAELAASSGTPQPRGGGSVNVGSRGPIQINPLNPVAQIKQEDILTGPFLGRWRR